jgi:hypothetical protein
MTLSVFQALPENQDHNTSSSGEENSVDSNDRRPRFASDVSIPVTVSDLSTASSLPVQKKMKISHASGLPHPVVTKKEKDPAVPKAPKLKIPTKDIRRNYPHIFARAFNSNDKDILNYCLTKYCVPDCICIYKYVGPESEGGYVSDNVYIHGIEAIACFWFTAYLAFPDAVFEVEETKLRVLANGSCSNVSKFIFFGTKVFHFTTDGETSAVLYKQAEETPANNPDGTASLPSLQESEGKIVSQVKTKPNTTTTTSAGTSSSSSSSSSKGDFPQQETKQDETKPIQPPQPKDFGLGESLDKPIMCIVIGTFSIFMNPEKKIYKIEFVHSLKK